MKFCDERIQNHLLNGGKIKRRDFDVEVGLNKEKRLSCDCSGYYILTQYDLTVDDWEIVEPEYNWDKIIEDKILCVFSDYEDYRTYVISPLIKVEDNNFSFKTIDELSYGHCKPFNSTDFNIAENLKDYEK